MSWFLYDKDVRLKRVTMISIKNHFFQVPSFQTPFGALIKTGVMMTGEMGFDDYFFQENVHPLPVTWVLFTLFVLIMVIILMNLLVRFLIHFIRHK